MKFAVVSYWNDEPGNTEIWLYNSQKEARAAIKRLWKQSFDLATEDLNFNEEDSYREDDFAVVAWKEGLCRYFEVVKQNMDEEIR